MKLKPETVEIDKRRTVLSADEQFRRRIKRINVILKIRVINAAIQAKV